MIQLQQDNKHIKIQKKTFQEMRHNLQFISNNIERFFSLPAAAGKKNERMRVKLSKKI
jgi:hypothetical protein